MRGTAGGGYTHVLPHTGPTPSRILIIRPSALGDVCRTVPVLVSLRAAYPRARIDWLVQDSFADAVRAHPALSTVVPFPRRRFGRWTSPPAMVGLWRWLRSLARADYDTVLDCQGLLRSAIFAQATGAPNRIGHADAREGAPLAYSLRVPPAGGNGSAHTVDRMLELAAAAGATPVRDLRLHVPNDTPAPDPRTADVRLVVLAPTSRWPGKRWPADRFAAIAAALLDGPAGGNIRVAVVGGAGERAQCGPLIDLAQREPGVLDLVGSTSVAGLLSLVSRAALVVANDSAAVHMAVGFNRPLVALYGPTDVARVGPYQRGGDVISAARPGDSLNHKDAAAGAALMERITLDSVLAACTARLSRP